MIRAVPQSLTSGHFDLMAGARKVGSLKVAPWRESGTVFIEEDQVEISKLGLLSLRYRISKNGEEIGWGSQKSWLAFSYQIDMDAGASYEVKPKRPLGPFHLVVTWDPSGGGEIVGQSQIWHPVEIRLPGEIPLEHQAVLFSVAHCIWDRARLLLVGCILLVSLGLSEVEMIHGWLFGG